MMRCEKIGDEIGLGRRVKVFKYPIMLHGRAWACRVAWFILLALGARDSDSNSDRPITHFRKAHRFSTKSKSQFDTLTHKLMK